MKSVITQGATVAKAIEEALKKADMPKEFFVKLLEDAQTGFLGFGSKKAKIALFFKEEVSSAKHQDSMFEKGSYENLFNNPNMKKQIEQQLKDLGLEIKQIVTPKKPAVAPYEPNPVSSTSSASPTKMHTRPLPNRSQQPRQQPIQSKQQSVEQTQVRPMERSYQADGAGQEPQSDEFRRKRRPRYYRPRTRPQGSGQRDEVVVSSQNKSNSDGSDF